MADLLNFAMLICATLGSLAFGVLAAYGILRGCFALMRPKSQRVPLQVQPEAVRAS
jgi:hypothetical protein